MSARGTLCRDGEGKPAQIENAAEIAPGTHLGMTCDPVRGSVRAVASNATGLGAIKLCRRPRWLRRRCTPSGTGLDGLHETMAARPVRICSEKYRGNLAGGLAVNVPNG